MLVVISLVVSMCSNVNLQDVSRKQAELQKQFPQAQVKVRFDKKCLKQEE